MTCPECNQTLGETATCARCCVYRCWWKCHIADCKGCEQHARELRTFADAIRAEENGRETGRPIGEKILHDHYNSAPPLYGAERGFADHLAQRVERLERAVVELGEWWRGTPSLTALAGTVGEIARELAEREGGE